MTTKEQESKQAPVPRPPRTASQPAGHPIRPHALVYPKIHVDYMATETLKYYDIPWEYDKVNQDARSLCRNLTNFMPQADPSYIVILREMDRDEINILFDYTKRLRDRRMFSKEAEDNILAETRYPFYHGKPHTRRDGHGAEDEGKGGGK